MQGFAGRWRAPQDRSGSTSLCAPASPGFTLVEVLVALAIVAVTLAAGLRAAGALVDGSQRLADVTAAQWCAENQLAELRLTRQFPGVGDGDFPCEMLGRRYSGTLRTRPTPNPNFRRVDAIVRDEAQRPLVTVSAIVTRL
jgi:general secretion pathway protein I